MKSPNIQVSISRVALIMSNGNHVISFFKYQMGAVIFATTDRGETAGDLAEQSGEQEQLLTILRAAEGTSKYVCGQGLQIHLK